MENKNYLPSPPLNTINIAYGISSQGIANFSQRKREEHLLQLSHPRQANLSPKCEQTIESTDAQFNDFNLKYGKSQTLKESVFNRMRIHIYRKDKRPKWLELPSYNHSDDHSISVAEENRQESKSGVRNRENKTSINRRKLMDLSYNHTKIKTNSSEEGIGDSFGKKTAEQHRFHDFALVNQSKINRIVKEYLQSERKEDKNVINSDKKKEELKIMRRKYRNLSDSISSFNKKNQHLKKINSPPILQGQDTETIQNEAKPKEKQDFQAWENSSQLFSSHKNGIIQYTKEFVNPEATPLQKSQTNIFSSKKRRKFLIKEKR